jgi:hypothetical protein
MARYQLGRSSVRQCLRPDRRLRADVIAVSAHLPALLAGLRWLYDTEQPAGSAIDPWQYALASTRGRRTLRFSPDGRRGAPTIEIIGGVLNSSRDHALAATELMAFGELIDGLGDEVVDTWIGRGRVIGGVELARPAHSSLLAAVGRFRSGRADSGPAVALAAVQRAAANRAIAIRQFAGPWPPELDPSGVLREVAVEAVTQLAVRGVGFH